MDEEVTEQKIQKSLDVVRRKIKFEKEVKDNVQILSDDEEEDDHNMKLKRLFKSRAKKLMERAESLTNTGFDLIPDYKFGSIDEEEKEIKLLPLAPIDPKIHSLRRLQSTLPPNMSSSLAPSLAFQSPKESASSKANCQDEEFKKLHSKTHHPACHSKLCGKARTKSFSNKEEFERSLKDFTCTI